MDLLEVSVQGLDEGCLVVAVSTLPWLVITVVPVHVVHEAPEAPTLLPTELAHTELLVVLRNLPLGVVTQRLPLDELLGRDDLLGSAPLPLHLGLDGGAGGLHVGLLDDLHVLVSVARGSAPPPAGPVCPVLVEICLWNRNLKQRTIIECNHYELQLLCKKTRIYSAGRISAPQVD